MEHNPDEHSLKCPKCHHGDPQEGQKYDSRDDIDCPHCSKRMHKSYDANKSTYGTKFAPTMACLWTPVNSPTLRMSQGWTGSAVLSRATATWSHPEVRNLISGCR